MPRAKQPVTKKAGVRRVHGKAAARSKVARKSDKASSSSSEPVEISWRKAQALLKNPQKKTIGRGAFGAVYSATFQGRKCAMKVGYKKKDETGETGEEVLLREIKMSLKGHGANKVIGVLGYHEGDAEKNTPPLLLLEWATKGDLISTRLPFSHAMRGVADLFEGIHDLHKKGIVHFDIKPENLLIAADDSVRIADFGLAHTARQAAGLRGDESCGSPGFEAPECVMKSHAKRILGSACTKVDVWAGGMSVAGILADCKQYPFDDDDRQIMQDAVDKAYHEEILDLRADLRVSSPELRQFFLRTMARSPGDRCTAKEGLDMLNEMKKAWGC